MSALVRSLSNFYPKKTPGDGHCLLHALRLSWADQITSPTPPSLHHLKCAIFTEAIENEHYRLYLPDYVHKVDYVKDVSGYILQKRYDTPFVDAVPLILSKALKIEINIINYVRDTPSLLPTHSDGIDDVRGSVTIQRQNDHYSGMGLITPSANAPRISYTSDQLKQLRVHTLRIPRNTRKTLFHLRIWKPKSIDKDYTMALTDRPPGVNLRNLVYIPVQNTQCGSRIKAALLNARSCVNKYDEIQEFVKDKTLDLLCLTETWLSSDSDHDFELRSLTPPGYELINCPRMNKRGGGLAILHRDSMTVSVLESTPYSSFEVLRVSIKCRTNEQFTVSVIYRPPSTPRSVFIDDFTNFLSRALETSQRFVCVGDFNIHVDNPNDDYTKSFNVLLQELDLVQNVGQSTHLRGHILDLVLTRRSESWLSNITLSSQVNSDHHAVLFDLAVSSARASTTKTIQYRSFAKVDKQQMIIEMREGLQGTSPATDVNTLVARYKCVTSEVVDKYAPLKTKRIVQHDHCPYYNDEVRVNKQLRRRLERIWRRLGTEQALQSYRQQCLITTKSLRHAKSVYYRDKLELCKDNPKDMHCVLACLTRSAKQSGKLPTSVSDQALADEFMNFFADKVTNIRNSFTEEPPHPSKSPPTSVGVIKKLEVFLPVTGDDIAAVVRTLKPKQCQLDPLPTWLLKAGIHELKDFMVDVVNASFRQGVFPDDIKSAIVTAGLKKFGHDHGNFKNFRPISNIEVLSKILEKCAAKQYTAHLTVNELNEIYQSAYKEGHSVETAILRIHNDITMALDRNEATLLILIDISAAFDTIDREVLLARMQSHLGVEGLALSWFRSYLTNRTQTVKIGAATSERSTLHFGVPQGSVLGPILFTSYMYPLGNLLRKFNISFHSYADDTQLYVSFRIGDDSNLARLQQAMVAVDSWMRSNFLKLNSDKTESIIFSRCKVNFSFNLLGQELTPKTDVKSLGVILDQQLSLEKHITNACRTMYYQLRMISKIRDCITKEACRTLVHSLVTSRLDFQNALYAGLPERSIRRLQRVQNYAARLVCCAGRRDHITPLLKQLHWLPVRQRISFKILVYVYQCVNRMAPVYLQDLIQDYVPSRSLRSGSQLLLRVTRIRYKSSDRAFKVAGPALWNSLPLAIRQSPSLQSFKRSLKTFLFESTYT